MLVLIEINLQESIIKYYKTTIYLNPEESRENRFS